MSKYLFPCGINERGSKNSQSTIYNRAITIDEKGEIINRHRKWLIEIDIEKAASSKRALDVAGHYSRPDVFTLQVDKSRQSPVEFINNSDK